MRTAFKEWAVVVDALGHGRQIVILRKGGLREGRDGFQVEHDRFLLLPTLFHQQRESVLDDARRRFDEIAPGLPPADRGRIEYMAEVADWARLDDLAVARRLAGQHIWRDDVIESRFDWGRAAGIHALAVRVLRLPAPVEFPMLPEYGGCKSWIDLASDVPVEEARPVLGDAEFGAALVRFRAALNRSSIARA